MMLSHTSRSSQCAVGSAVHDIVVPCIEMLVREVGTSLYRLRIWEFSYTYEGDVL